MSLFNIHDYRSSGKTTSVDIVLEVNCDDWKNLGLPRATENWTTWVPNTSIYDASMQILKIKGLVTLFLYDAGKIKSDFEEITWIHPDLDEQPYNPLDAQKRDLLWLGR